MAKEDPKCVSRVESVAAGKRRYCFRTLANVLSFAFSAVSVAFCIFLSVQSAEIKSRVLDLETADGERMFSRPPGFSMDRFNSMIQQRVDELLSQRTYESMVKIRTARQTSPECNCPPGNCWCKLMHAVSENMFVLDFMFLGFNADLQRGD
ncbi:hypothetical protein AALO_G00302740 [Alosa alosa]|uniref:Uncharacterized protein n=1 Tax=Alosa alosa TaxID=278164 RepID=A0AAV6FEW6_9TELE|nr:hypothetical protein AALO_G00302740 [Alosa alosa]